jgi:hypothetical protein
MLALPTLTPTPTRTPSSSRLPPPPLLRCISPRPPPLPLQQPSPPLNYSLQIVRHENAQRAPNALLSARVACSPRGRFLMSAPLATHSYTRAPASEAWQSSSTGGIPHEGISEPVKGGRGEKSVILVVVGSPTPTPPSPPLSTPPVCRVSMSSCTPQDFYRLVPTLLSQNLSACKFIRIGISSPSAP